MTRISDSLDFATLQTIDGLATLDREFLRTLGRENPDAGTRLEQYRHGVLTDPLQVSELLLEIAPLTERFLAGRFAIEAELDALRATTLRESVVSEFKETFVKTRARRHDSPVTASFSELDFWLKAQLGPAADEDMELAVALYARAVLDDGAAEPIERLTQWCVQVQGDVEGQARIRGWSSFRLPQRIDPAALVPLQPDPDDPLGRLRSPPSQWRQRDGFSLTDSRMPLRDVLDQVHYCVYCHRNDGDFCSKGFPEKKKNPQLGLKTNPLGVTLTGCPLEEKISEMHTLKRDGHTLAALVVAMIDNPMLPATGHRICNDCMKACIYQKQEPVDIPQIETRVLTDVLALPWGVEIYDLLARWNPLRARQHRMLPHNGRRVMVVGMGPAGFTMAHHLTMAGCAVTGIDGLKIEALPAELLNGPVRDYATLKESLDERILTGFGGVAEYGITVRWDKNFLKLIYLTLARRSHFQVFGGVRFGGTVTLDDAWSLGFDHVCIANGAGLPRVIHMGHSLARGMRQANDFLMALQLTGAAKQDSLANLQIRLPAVVIGGGLTAIDTATEVQAYYIKQVEKLLQRYETLSDERGAAAVAHGLDPESLSTLQEFLDHGRAVRRERARAAAAGEEPDFISLLHRWGGVSIVYRRSINESPAYQRNHEEIVKAMEEGIFYLPGLEPLRAELDEHGHVAELVCRRREQHAGRWISTGKEVHLPARAVLVAAGTFPNTIYEAEHPNSLRIEDNHFLPHVIHKHGVQPVQVAEHCKSPEFGSYTSYEKDRHRVTFIGDAHPVFHGSVVKAIASAARSYDQVLTGLGQIPHPHRGTLANFQDKIEHQLSARVEAINEVHPMVVEMWVHAPMAAKNFQPGQFFRLQTFEASSPVVHGTRLQIPLQTISGAGVDGDRVRLLLLRWGANARIAERLKPGDPLILMGPTGAPVEIADDRTVLVIAGSWGAAVMLALGPALRARNNRVLYLATYPDISQLYFQQQLEQCADQIVWATARGERVRPGRPQDLAWEEGDVIRLIERYRRLPPGDAGHIDLADVDQIMVMGSTPLLGAFQSALRGSFGSCFREDVEVLGTVGSPMQCMLKGVCAQCLQWQIDPDTGERTRAVFSCAMQDQPLMWIDVDNLVARQTQNRLQEHLTNLWVDHILAEPDPHSSREDQI